MKKAIPVILSLLVFVGLLILVAVLRTPEVVEEPEKPLGTIVHPPRGFEPDWESLSAYDGTISAEEFQTLVEEVYTVDDTWKQVITIEGDKATIQTADEPFVLQLRASDVPRPTEVKRYWGAGLPLSEMHIAIDPGHIGGLLRGSRDDLLGATDRESPRLHSSNVKRYCMPPYG